jgi:hypothetical protein
MIFEFNFPFEYSFRRGYLSAISFYLIQASYTFCLDTKSNKKVKMDLKCPSACAAFTLQAGRGLHTPPHQQKSIGLTRCSKKFFNKT